MKSLCKTGRGSGNRTKQGNAAVVAIAAPDAEKSFLAGLLEQLSDDPAAAKVSLTLVDQTMFTLDHAGEIFAAVLECVDLASPKPADVTAAVRRNASDRPVDGIDPAVCLVVDLYRQASTSAQAYSLGIARHAVAIEESHRQREVMTTLRDVSLIAADRRLDSNDLDQIDQSLARLRDVQERRGAPDRSLLLVPISEIESTPINWLWPQRIVGDGLNIVTGPVGNTKSLLTVDLAARVTMGTRWPDGTGKATSGTVIMFGNEDDPGKIIRPRLVAAGADLKKVFVCQGTIRTGRKNDEPAAMVLERDIAQLRRALGGMPDCRLIIFDPLPDYISADENSSAEVRAVLMPLARLAQEFEVAVVAVLHQNKKNDLSAVQRIGGSGAFAQVARVVLSVGNDPDDEATEGMAKRRVMLVAKNNYGERDCGQMYRLVQRSGDQVAVEWIEGKVSMQADALSRKPAGGHRHEEKRGDACDTLREALQGGTRRSDELMVILQDSGFQRRQIDHAASMLGVVKQRQTLPDGSVAWVWRLPAKQPALQSNHVEPHPEFVDFRPTSEADRFNQT